MRRFVFIVGAVAAAVVTVPAASATLANSQEAITPTTSVPDAPAALGPPITSGSMTVTLVDVHYSTAASQLVVVLEATATEAVTTNGRSSVYVGPDGQQVEAVDAVEPDELFPGATALVVMVFAAATSGGNVMFSAYTSAGFDSLDVTIPIPAST